MSDLHDLADKYEQEIKALREENARLKASLLGDAEALADAHNEVDQLRTLLASAREALEFYADRVNYHRPEKLATLGVLLGVNADEGANARAALTTIDAALKGEH